MSWIEYRLDEICSLVTDGKHGDCHNQENSGYYFISCKDVKDGKINYDKARQITKHDYEDTHKRTKFEPLDIALTNSGTIGRIAVSKDNDYTYKTTFQKSVAILKPINQIVDSYFLAYSLKSNIEHLVSQSGGTAQKNLLLKDLRRYKVPIPALAIQHKIASILSAYDDLIENNLQRIKLLEEAAQNIYKEWFVHFRFPGHKQVEFGEDGVPEGWKEKNIGELVEYHIGGGWGQEDYTDDYSVPAFVIRGTDIPKLSIGKKDDVPYRYHKVSNLKSRNLEVNDLIFEVSGGSKGQPVGRSLLFTEKMKGMFNGSNVMCASFCKLIRINNKECSPYYFESFIKDIYDNGILSQYENQSASNIINFKFNDFLEKQNIIIPSNGVRNNFESVIVPIENQIGNLGIQNKILKEARDILLPRLMDRRIEV